MKSFPVNWSPFQLFLGLILILRHIDANLLWEEAISITFLMVDKPNMAQMIARYDNDSGDDDITAKSNSRAIETKEKNLPFDGEKLGIVETLVSLMSPSFLASLPQMSWGLHFIVLTSSLHTQSHFKYLHDRIPFGQTLFVLRFVIITPK